MPRISKEKLDKIQEQIIFFLYSIFPKQVFTVEIAKEIARDEEFIKKLLEDLEKKEVVVKIIQNPGGIKYERRLRWRISNKTYDVYSNFQQKSKSINEIIEKSELK